MLNLLRRHGRNDPSEAHEPDQSCGLEYRPPRIAGLIDMNKGVSREQWNGHHFLPVAPRVVFGQQWEVDFAALMVELCNDSFFKPVSRLHREPLRQNGLY